MLSQKLHDSPYLETKKESPAPLIINSDGFFTLLFRLSAKDILILILAFIGGVLYLLFHPFVELFGWMLGFPAAINSTRAEISTHICPDTRRTYSLRWFDPARDSMDASRLLLEAFTVDPLGSYLRTNACMQRTFGHYWYKPLLESPSVHVLIEEWVEQQTMVGIVVWRYRIPSFFETLAEKTKWASQVLRSFMIYPRDAYMAIIASFATGIALKKTSQEIGENAGSFQYLAVKKGFQGQGIGSRLLEQGLKEIEDRPAYLESSNDANVPLYERFGFRVVAEHQVRPNSPPKTVMVRLP